MVSVLVSTRNSKICNADCGRGRGYKICGRGRQNVCVRTSLNSSKYFDCRCHLPNIHKHNYCNVMDKLLFVKYFPYQNKFMVKSMCNHLSFSIVQYLIGGSGTTAIWRMYACILLALQTHIRDIVVSFKNIQSGCICMLLSIVLHCLKKCFVLKMCEAHKHNRRTGVT